MFSLIVSRPLADEGFVFVLPIGSLITFFILAAIAGVVGLDPTRPARVEGRRAAGGDDGVGVSPSA